MSSAQERISSVCRGMTVPTNSPKDAAADTNHSERVCKIC